MKCKDNYKDQDKYRDYRNRWKIGYRKRTGSFMFEPREWTVEELRMVKAHDVSDQELSKRIKRSVGAIQTARYKIRKGYYDV